MVGNRTTAIFVTALLFTLFIDSIPADALPVDQLCPGFTIRMGGRYDNVRKCVASPTGTKGGIAADVSAFADFPVSEGIAVHADLPVMRPILFALAFRMLQFEPSAALTFFDRTDRSPGWVAGPAIGISLNYAPDYKSATNGSGRTASFFSAGPIIGGYAGLEFRRPGKSCNYQIGFSPYVIPLFGIWDPQHHRGIVIGGLVDAAFRFGNRR